MEQNRNAGKAILGIVLILVGIAFVGRTFNIFPHRIMHYIFSWQMILIVLGIIFISSHQNKATGWILLIIGLVFLIPNMVCIPFPIQRLFWPTMLILVGFFIIFRAGPNRRIPGNVKSEETIDDFAVFGGGDKIITSENFKGGKLTAIFGGSKIDLRKSVLAPGRNYIDVFFVFGGSTLIVPENWNVKVEVISIFGGFSDKRALRSDTAIEVGKEIVIKGICLFGGGDIKS